MDEYGETNGQHNDMSTGYLGCIEKWPKSTHQQSFYSSYGCLYPSMQGNLLNCPVFFHLVIFRSLLGMGQGICGILGFAESFCLPHFAGKKL